MVVSWVYPLPPPHPPSQDRWGTSNNKPPTPPERLHCLVPGALLWPESDLLPPSTSQLPVQGAGPLNPSPSRSRQPFLRLPICPMNSADFLWAPPREFQKWSGLGTPTLQGLSSEKPTSDPPPPRDMLPWIFLPCPLLSRSPRAWPRSLVKAATVLQPCPGFRYQRWWEILLSSALFTFDSK